MTDARNETSTKTPGQDQHDSLRDRASHAYESAVNRAGETAETSREALRDAAHQTGDFVASNPLSVRSREGSRTG